MTSVGNVFSSIIAGLAVLVLVLLLLFGGIAGCKSFNRYQKRADVTNQIRIQKHKLDLYQLKVLQAKKLARVAHWEGVAQKNRNVEIAKRLTPIFVQYEMIRAMESIASSGQNNSVIMIPSGAFGVPLISSQAAGQVLNGVGSTQGGK